MSIILWKVWHSSDLEINIKIRIFKHSDLSVVYGNKYAMLHMSTTFIL